MAEFINGLFSSTPSVERVKPFGLIVMAVAVIATIFADRISGLFGEEKRDRAFFGIKLASVIICIAGLVIAII